MNPVDEFLQTLRIERGASPHTLAGYKQTFIQLLRYCRLCFPAQPDPGLDPMTNAPWERLILVKYLDAGR